MRRPVLRTVIAYLSAVVITTILACIAQTQFVLARLAGIGADIPPALWLQTTLRDIFGLGPGYGGVIAAALFVGLLIGGALTRILRVPDSLVFAATAAAALGIALILIELASGVMPIGGARTFPGLLVQIAAGGVGGMLFSRLKGRRNDARKPYHARKNTLTKENGP